MITVTKQKPLEEIDQNLAQCQKVYLIGCGTCPTMLHTGGKSEVLEMRLSKSRPNTGIIKFKQTAFNQDNEIVMTYNRTSLAKRQGYDDGKLPQFGTFEKDVPKE